MSRPFAELYAAAYDSIYRDKDYAAECDLVERLFAEHAASPVREVLDLGCGTGGHAVPLAARGYDVVGVDISEQMLARAARRVEAASGASPRFENGDLRNVTLDRRFDAALMMFAVLGYQVENRDVLAALRNVRRHLRQGGLFVFDVWYGPAVLVERPTERVKEIAAADVRWLRVATPTVDVRNHRCTVEYHLYGLQGDRLLGEATERHAMRFFFPLELELLLASCGFELLHLGAFPDLDRAPDERTWNVLSIARAL